MQPERWWYLSDLAAGFDGRPPVCSAGRGRAAGGGRHSGTPSSETRDDTPNVVDLWGPTWATDRIVGTKCALSGVSTSRYWNCLPFPGLRPGLLARGLSGRRHNELFALGRSAPKGRSCESPGQGQASPASLTAALGTRAAKTIKPCKGGLALLHNAHPFRANISLLDCFPRTSSWAIIARPFRPIPCCRRLLIGHARFLARCLMAQSLSNILLHIVFSTKHRQPFIDANIERELFKYLATAC